jgi:hypothetical protein
VSEGLLIMVLETESAAKPAATAPEKPAPARSIGGGDGAEPQQHRCGCSGFRKADVNAMLVLGWSRRLQRRFPRSRPRHEDGDRQALRALGGVCLDVGCSRQGAASSPQ